MVGAATGASAGAITGAVTDVDTALLLSGYTPPSVPALAGPAVARTGDTELNEFGVHLRENGPEIFEAATRPEMLITIGAIGAVGAACLFGAARAAGPMAKLTHHHFFREPGEVMLGYRKGGWLVNLPVYARLLDRFMHYQIVAPTGQAKTSLMEFLARQDLATGMTVFAMELLGDLRDKLLAQAFALGRPIYYFDPSVPEAMKWNPIAGPTERAAERAVYTFKAAAESGNEQFFKNFNSMVLRHFLKAVSYWAHKSQYREPTLADLRRFCMDSQFRDHVLGVARKKDKAPKVTAPYIGADTRVWFEKQYLTEFTNRQRGEFTSGLQAILEEIMATAMVKRAVNPAPDEPALEFDTETMASGALVMPCIPVGIVGEATGKVLATWVLMDFIQSMKGRIKGGHPVAAYFDEVHRMLGVQSTELAGEFANFVTGSRHVHCAVHLAYQSFSLLPEHLRAVISTNTRTMIVSGALDHTDAMEAIENMGYASEEVRDKRRTFKGFMSGPGTYSVGEREMDKPEISEEELRYIKRGEWYVHRSINGNLQRPMHIKAGRAPQPAARFAVRPYVPEEHMDVVASVSEEGAELADKQPATASPAGRAPAGEE